MDKQAVKQTREQNREYAQALVSLCACAVRGEKPDPDWVRLLDLEILYHVARRHMLTGITAYALEAAGIRDARFTQAKGKAIRKVTAMDVEMERIFAEFDREGIWHVPLKGSMIKNLYPQVGMRQMSDHDILIDAERVEDIRSIMEGFGYYVKAFGTGAHDTYHKEPVYNFEFHRILFVSTFDLRISDYYQDIKKRLLKDDGEGLGYHFSPEDFYLYMTAHAYKHYSNSGTGLRMFLDTYVYVRHYGNVLNWDYVEAEAEKLGIADFEKRVRVLSGKLFEGKQLTAEEEEMFLYVLGSGAYGTLSNAVAKRMREIAGEGGKVTAGTKLRYVMERLFPGREFLCIRYPLAKYPVLVPFIWVYRIGRALSRKGKNIRREAGVVMSRNLPL